MNISTPQPDEVRPLQILLEQCDMDIFDITVATLKSFLVARTGFDEDIAACIRLETYGEVGLISNLAVRPTMREKKFGKQMMHSIEHRALRQDLKHLFLFAEEPIAGFFERVGYAYAEEAQIPDVIRIQINNIRQKFSGRCLSKIVARPVSPTVVDAELDEFFSQPIKQIPRGWKSKG